MALINPMFRDHQIDTVGRDVERLHSMYHGGTAHAGRRKAVAGVCTLPAAMLLDWAFLPTSRLVLTVSTGMPPPCIMAFRRPPLRRPQRPGTPLPPRVVQSRAGI